MVKIQEARGKRQEELYYKGDDILCLKTDLT